MGEIEDSTGRISALVGAAKQYSQMDRAAHQEIDVRDGLKSTLIMLGHKIKERGNITVVKDFDDSLPTDSSASRGAEPGVDQPDRQRHLRNARGRNADRPHVARRTAGSWSRSATPAWAFRPRCSRRSSSRSSPPSRLAKARGSASTSPIGWSPSGMAATFESNHVLATPDSRSGCHWPSLPRSAESAAAAFPSEWSRYEMKFGRTHGVDDLLLVAELRQQARLVALRRAPRQVR